MTAEIAIMNRTAVALAADSAATLSNGKIFNTVDKLFQLVCNKPIGIMIYGVADFMGIPLETVIKKFRTTKSYSTSKQTVLEYANSFFEFLNNELEVNSEVELEFARQQVSNILEAISNHHEELMRRLLFEKKLNSKNFEAVFEEKLLSVFKNTLNNVRGKFLCDGIELSTIKEKFGELILEVFSEYFEIDNEELINIVIELGVQIIASVGISDNYTGFVFAGFGENEIFPTLISYRVEGKILNTTKRKPEKFIDIDGLNEVSAIEPFAQKEMVDRFVYGVDYEFENFVSEKYRDFLSSFGNEIIETIYPPRSYKRKDMEKAVSVAVNKYLEKFSQSSHKFKEEKQKSKILSMVRLMPKSDMAAMAESLVNLTSTKRKVSEQSETVGGPIDVAIISKFDGFIWIKRKHYFEKDLNPRFFEQKSV